MLAKISDDRKDPGYNWDLSYFFTLLSARIYGLKLIKVFLTILQNSM